MTTLNSSSSILLSMKHLLSRTLQFKWNWRKRKSFQQSVVSCSRKKAKMCSRSVSSTRSIVLFPSYYFVSFVLLFVLSCILSDNFIVIVAGYPVVISSELPVTTSQTECDWRGRGGSTSTANMKNEPTTATSTSRTTTLTNTAAIGTTNHYDVHHYPSSGDNHDTSSSSTSQQISNSSHPRQDDESLLFLSSTLIQTISLRCTSGQIYWKDPKGGLKISLQPSILAKPYQLCLENASSMKSARILLETSSSHAEQKKLLPILTNSKSKCYQIFPEDMDPTIANEPTIIYIETHTTSNLNSQETDDVDLLDGGTLISSNHLTEEDDFPLPDEFETNLDGNTISLTYEIESFRGDGDPCRPCSEMEVLKTYCTADAVAKGSIVRVQPGNEFGNNGYPYNYNSNVEDSFDSIYIKSNFVIHQTQSIFTHINSLPNFLQSSSSSSASLNKFNTNQPHKLSSLKGVLYGGIIHHPSKCSPSIGDDEQYLWLIKFRFGRPVTDCAVYWDSWVDIVRRNQVECPVSLE